MMETSGVSNCDLCPFYGESAEALHYHKAKCHSNFFGHRDASSAASMLPLPPGFPAFPGLFNAAVQSQHHGDPTAAYHHYGQTAGAQQALQQAHQQQQQAVVQAAHHQLQARFGAESVKIPGSLGTVASNAGANTHHPPTTLPSSSSLQQVQQAQAAQAQAAQQAAAAAAAAQQQQHHEHLQRQRQVEAERLQQETQRLQEFSKEFSNLQDQHSAISRNTVVGGPQPGPLRHHQPNEQVRIVVTIIFISSLFGKWKRYKQIIKHILPKSLRISCAL